MWFLYFRRLIPIFLALTPTGIYSKCFLLYLHLISHCGKCTDLMSSNIFLPHFSLSTKSLEKMPLEF